MHFICTNKHLPPANTDLVSLLPVCVCVWIPIHMGIHTQTDARIMCSYSLYGWIQEDRLQTRSYIQVLACVFFLKSVIWSVTCKESAILYIFEEKLVFIMINWEWMS